MQPVSHRYSLFGEIVLYNNSTSPENGFWIVKVHLALNYEIEFLDQP